MELKDIISGLRFALAKIQANKIEDTKLELIFHINQLKKLERKTAYR